MVPKFTDSLVARHTSLVSRLGRHPLLNLKQLYNSSDFHKPLHCVDRINFLVSIGRTELCCNKINMNIKEKHIIRSILNCLLQMNPVQTLIPRYV